MPATVLGDKMKTAYEMQQPGIKKLLVRIGPLKSVEFEGVVSGTYTRHSDLNGEGYGWKLGHSLNAVFFWNVINQGEGTGYPATDSRNRAR